MNHQNNTTPLTITFFDSKNLIEKEKAKLQQRSYAFFEKYIGKSEVNIVDIVDHFIEKGISIRYSNNAIQVSIALGKFFLEDPIGCVHYMNTIVDSTVIFKYINGGIEIDQGGGPHGPAKTLIGKNNKAANDAIFAKAA